MIVLNLLTLKVEEAKKDTQFLNIEINMDDDHLTTPKALHDEIALVFENKTYNQANEEVSERPTTFVFDLNTAKEVSPDDFLSYVNITLATFFEVIVSSSGRPREHRLDVPAELLDQVHCSRGLLKRAINYTTTYNIFNIEIRCGEYIFKFAEKE